MANNDPMQIDVTLQATDPLNVSLGEMYKGGDGSFAGLSDVALDNPTNGQVPKYNAETEKWENADDNTVSNLTDLEDVNISNPTDGQIVRYDAETDKFIASDEQVGSEVSVTQIQSTGTKVATITVDEVDTDIYAPDPTSVSVTQTQVSGTKVGEISVDGQTTELFAPTPTSPTEVTVTQIQSTGTKIATVTVDGTATDLFAPEGGGGASSADQISVDDTDLAYEADDVQEALEKITKRLTYVEYKALTDAEKKNGTIYFITDVNGDGQSFQPVIYSEEEREIGVWTDGKPLYEKTINLSGTFNLNNNEWTNLVNLTDYSVDSIISCDMLFSSGNEQGVNDGRVRFSYLTTTKYLRGAASTNTTVGNPTLSICYTKTTDTAGSGTWTPQGVPAVHYSTDEQVVGTWIDGSTIYEKGLTVSGSLGDTFNYIPHGVSNFNQLLDYFGYCTYGSSDKMNIPSLRGSSYVTISNWDATNIRLERANLSSAISDVNLVIRYTKSS